LPPLCGRVTGPGPVKGVPPPVGWVAGDVEGGVDDGVEGGVDDGGFGWDGSGVGLGLAEGVITGAVTAAGEDCTVDGKTGLRRGEVALGSTGPADGTFLGAGDTRMR
jgi:hypothetical protein